MSDELLVRIAYKIRASRKHDFNMSGNEAQDYARIALAEIAAAGMTLVGNADLADLQRLARIGDDAESAAYDE